MNLLVGIQHHPVIGVVNQSDRQWQFQFRPLSFADHATHQTSFEHVKFRLTHRAFEPQQEPIVKMSRIIETVLIEDQCMGQSADLREAMPVGAVTCQPGDLQPHNQSRLAQAHLSDQPLKAFAVGGRSG